MPKRPETKKSGDRLMDRMKKVDPNQSERYRQRTGE
ncbi:MAG: ubiquitin-like protein UBact [Nitrospirae bacterium]|nr:ubiquitin-like protein UBact [Nitrospirota bacterium]